MTSRSRTNALLVVGGKSINTGAQRGMRRLKLFKDARMTSHHVLAVLLLGGLASPSLAIDDYTLGPLSTRLTDAGVDDALIRSGNAERAPKRGGEWQPVRVSPR